MDGNILIVGSGYLVTAICQSLAMLDQIRYRVTVCARSPKRLNEICYLSNLKALLSGSSAVFDQVAFEVESDDVGKLLTKVQPDIVVNCTSYHSPWEHITKPSLWTGLVQRAGFGITLPLQAAFAIRLARAIAEYPRRVLFINGCYPDAVNPVLHALGLPIFCGIGNVGMLAATIRSALGLSETRHLQVLGHHLHLYNLETGVDEARAWVDGRECENVGRLLMAQRTTDGLELNSAIGFTAALLLREILKDKVTEANVPGPLGLPGGYPVRLCGASLELNLPCGLSVSQAQEWNETVATIDGVRVAAGAQVEFTGRTKEALLEYLPELANGFPADVMHEATECMLKARDRLRQLPLSISAVSGA